MKCYICRRETDLPHAFYKSLCVDCGEKNLAYRQQTQNLCGYTAVVTGARIKIGYHTALRLLRNNASVIATSRFPHSAFEAFSNEPDFAVWCARLHLFRLDFLKPDTMEFFFERLYAKFDSVDVLVNNAALTIKKEAEDRLLGETEQRLKARLPCSIEHDETASVPRELPSLIVGALNREDRDGDGAGTQGKSAWVKRSGEVNYRELLEVQVVNAAGPYILCTALKPLMQAAKHKNKFIVNVSSIEGKFAMKQKSPLHPHTNMAKAALNMMTKTLAGEYKKEGIYLYSVDPGWVSNQFPNDWTSPQKALPLDFEDAAARITAPLFDWKDADKPPSGIFLKDFEETQW